MTSEGRRRRRRLARLRKAEEQFQQRAQQHGNPCTYCARPMSIEVGELYPTEDHVEPQSRGGKITVWACYTCNHVKRDMTVDEWANYRADHDEWWCKGRRARRAANWTPRRLAINIPPCRSETGPEAEGIRDALTA